MLFSISNLITVNPFFFPFFEKEFKIQWATRMLSCISRPCINATCKGQFLAGLSLSRFAKNFYMIIIQNNAKTNGSVMVQINWTIILWNNSNISPVMFFRHMIMIKEGSNHITD